MSVKHLKTACFLVLLSTVANAQTNLVATVSTNAPPENVWSVRPDDKGEVDWVDTAKWWGGIAAGLFGAWQAYDYLKGTDVGDDNGRPGEITPEALAAAQAQSFAEGEAFGRTQPAETTTRIFISGAFQASGSFALASCGSFTPGMSFAGSTGDLSGGVVAGVTGSQTCTVTDGNGTWRQTGDYEIYITTADPFYAGPAVVSPSGIVLMGPVSRGVRLAGGRVEILAK